VNDPFQLLLENVHFDVLEKKNDDEVQENVLKVQENDDVEVQEIDDEVQENVEEEENVVVDEKSQESVVLVEMWVQVIVVEVMVIDDEVKGSDVDEVMENVYGVEYEIVFDHDHVI